MRRKLFKTLTGFGMMLITAVLFRFFEIWMSWQYNQPIGERPNSPGVGEMLLSGRYPMEQLKTMMGRYVERLEPNPKENFVIGKLPVSCYKNENRFCYDGAEDYQVRYIYLLIPGEGWRFRTVDLYKSLSQQSDWVGLHEHIKRENAIKREQTALYNLKQSFYHSGFRLGLKWKKY